VANREASNATISISARRATDVARFIVGVFPVRRENGDHGFPGQSHMSSLGLLDYRCPVLESRGCRPTPILFAHEPINEGRTGGAPGYRVLLNTSFNLGGRKNTIVTIGLS